MAKSTYANTRPFQRDVKNCEAVWHKYRVRSKPLYPKYRGTIGTQHDFEIGSPSATLPVPVSRTNGRLRISLVLRYRRSVV